jgi:toxin ParE1/3/4
VAGDDEAPPCTVVLSDGARDDLQFIAAYLTAQGGSAGPRFREAAEETLTLIAHQPRAGSPWESDREELDGVRKLPVKGFEKYLVFYREQTLRVEVVRVLHGMRDLERILEDP